MQCVQCGTQNPDTYKFCQKCGTRLPVPSTPPPPPPVIRQTSATNLVPSDPVAQAALLGLGGSALGGILIVLGWFTPWFGLSGLSGQLSSLLGYSSSGGLLGMGSGVGNGLQLTLLAVTSGFAAFNFNAPLLGLLALFVALLMITIVIIGILFIRAAITLFESRPANPAESTHKLLPIRAHLHALRSRSTFLFVLLVIIFIVAAAIPFGTSLLGRGFYLTGLGAIFGYVSAMMAQNRIRNS